MAIEKVGVYRKWLEPVPIENGKLQLGAWQQIVLIDFDEKPRSREIIVKIIKED